MRFAHRLELCNIPKTNYLHLSVPVLPIIVGNYWESITKKQTKCLRERNRMIFLIRIFLPSLVLRCMLLNKIQCYALPDSTYFQTLAILFIKIVWSWTFFYSTLNCDSYCFTQICEIQKRWFKIIVQFNR